MKLPVPKKPKLIRINTLSIILGITIILYFIAVSFIWGRIDAFNMLMIFFGVLWIIVTKKIEKVRIVFGKLPKIIRIFLKIFLFAIILSFLFIQGAILFNMRSNATESADYVIILGCQVNGTIPSVPLVRRVNTAINYLNRNQFTNVIVSGGQGPGEDISEAEAMRRLLIRSGINEKRIFIENRSRNTKQNLEFSNNLYNLLNKNVIIVSSDYHMFRVILTARKLNYKNIEIMSGKTQLSVLPAYLLREYVSIMYNLVIGRI